MRDEFVQAWLRYVSDDRDAYFLTGDVGYRALEPIRDAIGERFINCGVAEQNMMGVAAGLARAGAKPWVYSIAPFVTARPFEFVRNDIGWNNLDVKIVGNGGGFGYGIMGPTHHAIDDLALLATHMRCHVPAFVGDTEHAVKHAASNNNPAYIRLGIAAKKEEIITREDRELPVVVTIGPIVEECGPVSDRVQIVALSDMPHLPVDFVIVNAYLADRHVITLEEHQRRGGLGDSLGAWLLKNKQRVRSFQSLAVDQPPRVYGDQKFLRRAAGVDTAAVAHALMRIKAGEV